MVILDKTSGKQKFHGFSMVEILVSLTIMAVISSLLAASIVKKSHKVLEEAVSGKFICYKDAANKLHQRVELTYRDTTTLTDKEVESCSYKFPTNAKPATMYLIGGGGGGGTVSVSQPTCSGTNGTAYVYPLTNNSYGYISLTNTLVDCVYYENEELVRSGGVYNASPIRSSCYNFDPSYSYTLSSYRRETTISIPADLTPYFDNSGYNNYILKDTVIDLRGGGRASACNIKLSPKIGERYVYANGVPESSIAIGDNLHMLYLAPTAGIYWSSGGTTFAINGVPWTYKESGNGYGADNCPTNKPSATGSDNYSPTGSVYISYKALNNCSVQYSTAGKPGQVVTKSLGSSFAGKDFVVEASDIGSGGNGTAGGNTTHSSVNLTATGGAAGITKSETMNTVGSFNKVTEKGREHPYETIITDSMNTESPSYSDYIKDKVLPELSTSQADQYIPKNATCYAKQEKSSCENASVPTGLSYGAAGGGGNSIVVYDPISQLNIRKANVHGTQQTTELGNSKLITGKGLAGKGMGGAIIVEW